MIQTQLMKTVAMMNVLSRTAAATNSGFIDTKGFDHLQVLVLLDLAATNPTGLVLQDGPTTSSFTSITAFVGDTAYTIPAADTDDPQVVRFEVNLTNLERYINLLYTAGATQLAGAVATLSRGDVDLVANDTAGMGASVVVYGP